MFSKNKLDHIPKIETKELLEIKAFQEEKLKELLEYLNKNSPYYSRLFKTNNIDVSTIRSIEDLSMIPVTTKDDLQKYNDDFICTDKSKITDYVTTSGTLGEPVTFALTDKDLNRLAYNEAISFFCANGSENDVYQLTTTMDRRFMAGLAYFLGIREMGAAVIRVGSGIPELQWDTILKMKPTVLIGVPSFILKLIEFAEKNNITYKTSSIQSAVCIGESIRNEDFTLNALGKKIKNKWDIKLYSTYASTEMSTAFTECESGKGGHHHPELIITEFLDENDMVVKQGEAGELTITTLGVKGMPLLRFKTGDIVKPHFEPCGCGRKTMRLGPVIGRKKQMVKYKGTSIYPPAMYDLLNDFDEVQSYVVEIYTNEMETDEIIINVCTNFKSESLEKEIKDHFRAKLRVAPKIKFCSEQTINKLKFPKTSRKPITFIDHRIY